jgi:hypothetical protein
MASIRFLIIGAQKGGTTSLFEYLRRHPEIHMPVEKDIAFFNRPNEFRRGGEWYLTTVLRDAPPDAVCGEASTYYMSGTPYGDLIQNEQRDPAESLDGGEPLEEVVPKRIKQFLPDVKLICVLRDPVARAYSHHRMMVLERAESRSFDEAIDQLLTPRAIEQARIAPTRTNNYVVNGEYGRVLGGFLRTFPRAQLMAIFSDDLAERPAQTLATLFEFIGVEPDFLPDNVNTRYRLAAEKERIPGLSLYALQANLARVRPARALWHRLPDRARIGADRTFRVMSYRVQMWNAQRGVSKEDISPSVRKRLIAHFRPDGEELSGSLDQQIPWLAAWGHS